MIRKIVKSGSKSLREVSKPVKKIDKKVLSLINDLTDTLRIQKDPEGVGLAACQVGVNLRIFVMLSSGKIIPIVNPEVLNLSKEKVRNKKVDSIMEGCLSLPNYYAPLKRAKEVTLKYLTPKGAHVNKTFRGFEAQIVQHEIDHLNGAMFLDRLLEQKQKLYKMTGNDWEEVEIV
jgi:peptide deformylase